MPLKEEPELTSLEKFIYWEKFANLTALYWSAVSEINGVVGEQEYQEKLSIQKKEWAKENPDKVVVYFIPQEVLLFINIPYCSYTNQY